MRFLVLKLSVPALAVLLAACGGGSSGGTAPPPPPATDTTPSAFSFTDQSGVAAGSTITSAPVTITGINAASAVTVAGGTYSVGCGATYTGAAGTITSGETVCVRHTASALPSTATDTTLTVGGVSDVFTSTTAAGGVSDTTPDAFHFTDQTGVAASSTMTSAPVTITGIDAPSAVTVTGGTYSVGCTATYTAAAGTVTSGQTICARHTSSASAATATNTTVTVGGVADTFTSTTAAAGPVVGLLPFLTGGGAIRLLDPTAATGPSNPVTVDTGLAPPPAGTGCHDCFAQAETWFTGTMAGTVVSNLHAARLAYAKRGSGNDAGAAVFVINLVQGASNAPVQVSSTTDACRVVRTETTDYANVDATAVVLERAGADHSCSAAADNLITVIRLNSPATDAGIDLALATGVRNPLHARLDGTGAVTGYVSFEVAGVDSYLLVRRDAALANPVTLKTLGQVYGASLERADLAHLYVTATPAGEGLQLFRVETGGALSPTLYTFAGFNAGNPIQDAAHDASFLYFSDENRLLRVPVDSTSENAAVITTMPCVDSSSCLRIENRAFDATTGRVVFEAQDDGISVAGGVFSAAGGAADAPATSLEHNPAPSGLGPFAILQQVAGGRAYITVAYHNTPTRSTDAVQVATDGTGKVATASAYWAGYNRAESFDLAAASAPASATIFLARRAGLDDGSGTDTLSAVDPVSGAEGAALGTVTGTASVFLAININGVGRYALARVEMNRSGSLDYDVSHVDTAVTFTGELPLLASDPVENDIPLDSLQRLTGNLCMICL